jgi:very-short-patch-repair endonuclease
MATRSRLFARRLVSHSRAAFLEEHARRTRFAPTPSEQRLWLHLSGSKIGFAFRRQLVVGNFIVDLACTKVRLVVEIDGAYHKGRVRKDASGDWRLAELGWRVLRVTDEDVRDDIASVLVRIRTACLAGP